MSSAPERGTWPELRIDIARLDQRDNLARHKRQPGDATRPIAVDVLAKDLEITTSRIADGTPIHLEGIIEPVMDGIEFRGVVKTEWQGECRRCLSVITEPLELDLSVTFLRNLSDEDDAEAYPIVGDFVDLGFVVREELMLALPLSPLCTDDCVGADPERYPSTPESAEADESGMDEDGDPPIDPRWAGLSALTFDEE